MPAARARAGRKGAARTALFSRGYVLFLAVISIMTVLMCVQFLRLKSVIRDQTATNNALRTELMSKRAENDALFEDIANEADLEDIRRTAVSVYHMKYAAEDQIVWYTDTENGYVRQYLSVPGN